MMHNFFAAALLLIIAIHFGDCTECGSLVLNGTSGDFGLQNPSKQDHCVWTITNANSYITITYLDILDEDTLKVYDGVQESETLVKTIRKGDKVPLVIGCAAANSTIEFVVGSQGGSGGFNGTYNTDVGQIYSEEWTDFVHAPFYLTKSGNMTVEYHLTSEKEDGRLSLTFDQLQVADFTMAVYNGPVVNSTKLIDSFNSSTSTSVPNDVITEDRALTVQITFCTAKVQNLTMSYLTLSNNNADCSGTYTLTNTSMAHTITSPGFPGPYVTNTWCRWLITAPEHTTIRVNINDLQLQPANDFVRLVDGGSRYGRSIMWFGANATDEAKHGLYLTSSNNLWMEFFSDQSLVDGLFNISITMQAFSKTVVSPTLIDVLEISSATIPAAVSVIEDVIYYRLIAEQDKQVQISANASAMRLLGGTVDFYEGSEESDDALITTWRTDNYYSDVLSNSNVMLVVARKFVNDGKLTNQTLKASVVYVSKDVGSVTSVGEDGNYELQKPAQHEPTEWNIINKDSVNSARLLTIGGMKLCTDCSIKVYNSSHATNDTLIYTWDETTTLQPNTLIYSTEFKLIITTPAPTSNSDSDILASLIASFSTVPTCAQTIAGDSSGTVTSMNYPDRFPANAQCLWTFNTTSVTNVNLRLAFDHAQFSNDAALSFHQHGHAGYPNTTTQIDGSSSIPDDIIVSANATLTQSIVLNFTSPINAITPSIGDGFSLRYYYSNCGGSVVDVTEAITSPGYPASINTTVHCVWLVTVEPTDPQHNSTINTIKLSLDMKAPNNFTTLSMHDGGNVHAPIIYANQTQTTNNKLWIEYKTEVEAGSKHVGAPFSLALSKLACQKSQQCDNGRCMLDGWKCNGNNDCGDYSDEKDCGGSSTKKSGVSAGMVVLAIFITIIITVVLTIAAPIAYRRWRSSRMPYGTLHEPVSIDA